MSSSAIGWAQRAGNAGERPATHTAARSQGVGLAPPLQLEGIKTPAPSPGAGFAPGGEGGRGENVHTDSNIFPKIFPRRRREPQVFEGTTLEGELRDRNRKRFQTIHEVFHALYQAGEQEPDLRDHAIRLLRCGRYHRKYDFSCSTYRLVPLRCNSIFCHECSAKRSRPLIERISSRIDPKRRYWFLTITVKNWMMLTKEGLAKLVAQFSELRETSEWEKYVTGGIYSVEATFNERRSDWHPHLHVLVETTERLPKSWVHRLRVRWRRITGSHVINLRPVYGTDKTGRKTRRIDRGVLCELVKYATKANEFSRCPERVVEFFRAFTDLRRVQTFGSFFGVPSEAKESFEEGAKDPEELVGCACGKCRWRDATPGGLFHETNTFVDANGVRQLKLFAFDTSPPKPVEPEVPENVAFVTKNLDLFFHQNDFVFSN